MNAARHYRLTESEALELAIYVAGVTERGAPLEESLRGIAADAPNDRVAGVCGLLADRMETDGSLEAALESLGNRLPRHIRGLVVAIAQSGRAGATIDDLMAHERLIASLSGEFRQALVYPAILLAALAIWVLLVGQMLLPLASTARMADELAEDFGTTRSRFTWLWADSDFATQFAQAAPIALLSLAGVLVLVWIYARWLGGGALVSQCTTGVPLVGKAWWYRGLADTTGLLSMSLGRGLRMGEALRLTALGSRGPALAKCCRLAALGTELGQSLSQALASSVVVPATLRQSVAWGEQAGALEKTLIAARDMFAERFDYQIRLMRLVIPPIAFLIVAAVAASIAGAMFEPMFMLIKLVSDLT